jgi:hypothetical protein
MKNHLADDNVYVNELIFILNRMEKQVFLNFKNLEVVGATKQEALDSAPFKVLYDATQAYKNWMEKQEGAVTEAMKKNFYVEYLAKKTKNAPGVGCSITVEAAIADTRERPYKITDVKNEKGKRKYSTIYIIKNRDTNEILAKCDETKAKAKDVVKKLYKDGFKGRVICTYTKEVTEGEPVAFYGDYTPSKSTKSGRYIVFGIEA